MTYKNNGLILISLISLCFFVLPSTISATMDPLSDEAMQKVTGREGLVADLDLRFTGSEMIYSDDDGCPSTIPGCSESGGVLQLGKDQAAGGSNSDVSIGDPGGADGGAAVRIEGLSLDADGNNKLVFDPGDVPTGSNGPDIRITPINVGEEIVDSTDQSDFNLQIFDPHVNNSLFVLEGTNGGFNLDGSFDLVVSNFELIDTNGCTSGSACDGDADGDIEFRDINFGGGNASSAFDLSGISINADQNVDFGDNVGTQGGLTARIPSGKEFGVEIGSIEPGNNQEAIGISMTNAEFKQEAVVKIGADQR